MNGIVVGAFVCSEVVNLIIINHILAVARKCIAEKMKREWKKWRIRWDMYLIELQRYWNGHMRSKSCVCWAGAPIEYHSSIENERKKKHLSKRSLSYYNNVCCDGLDSFKSFCCVMLCVRFSSLFYANRKKNRFIYLIISNRLHPLL